MTVTDTSYTPDEYNGNGSTTNFPITFKYLDDSHVVVKKIDTSTTPDTVTTLVSGNHYNITGGEVVTTGGNTLVSGETLWIGRTTPQTQATDFKNLSSFDAEDVETALDKTILVLQENITSVERTLRTQDTESSIGELPLVEGRASKYMAFDQSGDPTAISLQTRDSDGARYYADPTETDQGAAGSGGSILDLINDIGSGYGTIVLLNSGLGGTTSYTLDTSISLSTNNKIFIEMEPGATFARTTGDETFTFFSPDHLVVPPRQQVTAVDMLVFTNPGTVYPDWWGAVGDDSTDCTNGLQYAFDAGTVTHILDGVYDTGALTISNSGRRVEGTGTIKVSDSTNDHAITITGDNVVIDGITLDGNRANNTAGNGIYSVGADNVSVLNCVIHDVEDIGVVLKGGNDFKVHNNVIYDCAFQHILSNAEDEAMTNVSITDNRIYVSAFGINTDNGGIGTNASSNSITRVTIAGNIVDFPVSTSAPVNQVLITTYGNVSHYVISNNIVSGGRIGISNGGAHDGVCEGNTVDQPYQIGIEVATGGAYETDYVSVKGNVVVGSDSGGTEYTKGIALTSSAASSHVKHLSVKGNVVRDCFLPIQVSETSSGSVEDVSVNDNHVTMCSTNGRIDITEVEDLTVRGNHIDLNGETTSNGIRLNDCDNFQIEGNYIFNAIAGTYGILVAGTSIDITHGSIKNNSFEGSGGTAVALTGYIRYTGDTNTVDITGPLEIKDNLGASVLTAASGDGNPSIAYNQTDFFLSGSSTVTDLIHDYVGAKVTIRSTGTPTIQDNASLVLAGGTNYAMTSGDTLVLQCFSSGVWTEISRSVN